MVLGNSRSTVSKWENGESRPKIKTLPQLAKLLNCSIEELIFECHNKDSDLNNCYKL